MLDFLTRLFDTSDFPARWNCGTWTSGHGWLHILSDLAIWSAYFAIPCILMYFVLRRRDIPFRTIFWLFGAFILACGTTHLMEAIIFWHPLYRLAGVIKLGTALVSWGTVAALVPMIPKALAMRSPDELEREIVARQEAEIALQRANTELERRIDALRSSEERFRLLVDGTKDHAIFMLDPSGKVASWNPGGERIKQYQAGEIIGRHFSCFYPDEDVRSGKPEQDLQVAAVEGRYEEEGWRVRKDGSKFWASAVITALRDDTGKVRGFSKVTRDMTDRKQAEENAHRLMQEETARRAAEQYVQAIEEQRERLRVTLISIGDGVIATDADSRVTLLNPVAETLTGWTNADAVGQPLDTVFQIVNELTRQVVENPVAKVLASGQIVGLANHTLLVARNGTERPIDDSAAPIRDQHGRVSGVILVFRDITDRKREEAERRKRAEQLAEAEVRIRSVVDNVVDGIITIDSKGTVQSLNPAGEKLFGYTADEVVNQNVKLLMPEPYRSEHDAYLANYLRTGEAKIIGIGREVEGRRKDGSTFPLELSVGEFRLNHHRYFTGVVRDITDRKRFEQSLRDANRRKDEFLATLAHELRNPLAPIRNSLQILKMPRVDAETSQQTREMMERQVHHLVRLVDDLLDVSRVMRGKIELRKESIELASVVARAVETAQPLIDTQGHQLDIDLPRESLRIMVDPVRLAQVIGNLLTNAAKYTKPKGRIWVTGRREEGKAVLRVRDNGIGIAGDMLPHVFELFVQADQASTHSQGGLGIGLTLVKDLIEMHDGTVEAHSAGLGQGSEFLIRLPLVADEDCEPVTEVHEEPQPARISGHRLLVVDDNQDAANSLATLLRLQGHEVQVAHDGSAALELARTYHPRMVFLDIGMPGLDGFEVARQLRRMPGLENTILTAVTGWGQQEDRRRTAEAGFDHHFVKPLHPKALESLLADLQLRNETDRKTED